MLALLESPCIELNEFENAQIEFDYHMFGSEIGSLTLEVSIDNGATYSNLFNISGQQQTANTSAWISASIDLSQFDGQTIKLRFSAITGTSFRSDIALDNIVISASLGNDTQAPTIPTNLVANNTTETTTDLSWDASTDNGSVADYDVLQDGVIVATVADINTQITGLIANTSYAFTVVARDLSGNVSQESNALNVTTLEEGATPPCTGPAVSTYPYSESFESGLGLWTQSTTDDINWTQRTGSTPSVTSGPTGPLVASVGSQYLYTESSGNGTGFPNMLAILNSPCLDLSGHQNAQFTFDYHMFGAQMGDLTIEVSTDNGNTYNIISNTLIITNGTTPGVNPISGQQQTANDQPWRTQSIDLSPFDGETIRLRFSGLTGSSFTSDIAIDNINLTADIIVNDTEVPSAPTNLAAINTTQTTTDLNWAASTDNVGVVDYDVIQDGIVVATVINTTYQVIGLTASTTYAFEVLARDAAGNSSVNSSITNVTTLDPPDTTAPSAPTNLIANNITETTTNLSWTASTDNVSVVDYDVIQDGIVVATVIGTTYQAIGLTASTNYIFEVLARDAAGNISTNSNEVNVTTIDVTAPTAPTNLTASNISQTTVNLNWTASTDNVDVINYEVIQDGLVVATISATSYQVTTLTASTNYVFEVRASDSAGNTSVNSNTVNITTLDPPDTESPSIPANLIASNVTQTTVDLTWDASGDNVGVVDYQILQDGVVVGTSVTTIFQLTGLIPNTGYSINVRARDAADNISENSNTVNVTTGIFVDSTPPSAPTNLSANNTTETTTDLSWNASTDDVGIVSYDVIQDGIVIATVTITNYQVTGLVGSTDYAFQVLARDAAGNTSINSNTSNVTTQDPPDIIAPSAPTNLIASNTTETSTDLNWTASTDNVGVTGYDVIQDGVVVTTIVGTSYQVLGLIASTSYVFVVRANDSAGNQSENSNAANVTTLDAPIDTGCSGGITTFPYEEGFEAGLGDWTQSTADNLDWTRDSNGTPSNGTGPASAIEGSFYMYVEASGQGTGFPNIRAILNSPCFDLSNLAEATFTFDNHMFGSNDFGTIDLEISEDDGQTWTSIWNRTGNRGNQWNTENIDLTPYVGGSIQLRFNRVTGGIWQADFALDNVSLIEGTPPPPPPCTGPSISSFPYTETFNGGIGLWTQDGSDDGNWTLDANGTPSSNTGPSADFSGNSNYFFTEALIEIQGQTQQ